MKVISWNVNGIRAGIRKGFNDFLVAQDADILCLQETKARPEQVIGLESEDYCCFWNSAEKKGYSGTAIFSKEEPLAVTYGLGVSEHDTEGRVITAEFQDFNLVTVYTPNSKRGLLRLGYRQKWDADFRHYLMNLKAQKPVILCGDLNVAHEDIDLSNPKANKRSAGFTKEERQGFSTLLDSGFTDSFRHFNNRPNHYTWWSNFNKCRERNIGWRIDYFCVSENFMPRVESSRILADVHGSDHCPILLTLKG
jgi:exodeoxyribonuclease III